MLTIMQLESFERSPVGRLVDIEGFDPRHGQRYAHKAFVPEELPEVVELTRETWEVVTAAVQALGRLDQAGRQIPNPGLLRRPAIRREAVSTSALEGTYAAFTDVFEADVVPTGRMSPELVEVLNYVEAAEHAFESIKDRRLTVGLLCELQAILVARTKADGPNTGQIRDHQVVIGAAECKVTDARFVPPPPGDLLVSGFRAWEEWVARDRSMPAIVQAALAHYQFETLHPFHDGNGRIGRLVVVLQLMQLGDLREPLLTISPWLEVRRREYQDRLLAVSQTGDYDRWVRFFVEALRVQADDTLTRVEQLLAYQDHIRSLIRETPLRGVAAQIAEDLVGQPIVTPTWASRIHRVTYPAANAAVGRLVEVGLLKEMTGRNYDRVFAAAEILDILERQGSPRERG